MSAIIKGKVFNDLRHTGLMQDTYAGLGGITLMLSYPDSTYHFAETDPMGNYSFDSLSLSGTYNLFETVLPIKAENLDTLLTQPKGFTSMTTPKSYSITLTEQTLTSQTTFEDFNFGHDVPIAFEYTTAFYALHTHTSTLHEIDCITGNTRNTLSLNHTGDYGCIGFNFLDQCLYGYDYSRHNAFRLDGKGDVTFYAIQGLPHKNYVAGDLSPTGTWYLLDSSDNTLHFVDLNPNSSHYMRLIKEPLTLSDLVGNTPLAFNPKDKCLYTLKEGTLLTINTLNGEVFSLATKGTPSTRCKAAFFDCDGYFYCLFDQSFALYRLQITSEIAIGEPVSKFSPIDFTCGTRYPLAPLYITLGTAPLPYTSSLAENGPKHGRIAPLFIHTTAKKTPLDTFTLKPLQLTDTTYALTLYILNNTDHPAYLYAWLDFNCDGVFQGNEGIAPLTIPCEFNEPQPITITFQVPKKPLITLGSSYIRVRLTSDLLMNQNRDLSLVDTRSIGPASDGDILDCPLLIEALAPVSSQTIFKTCEVSQLTSGSCEATDPCKGQLTYSLEAPPFHGKVTIDQTTGVWAYTPFENYIGEDAFVLKATSSVSNLCCTLPAKIQVAFADLSITTVVSKKEATVKDTLTYTTLLENKGTLSILKPIFRNALPLGLTFLNGSVAINGIEDFSAVPEYGIPLPMILPKETCTLSFQVDLTPNAPSVIENTITLDASYALDAVTPPTALNLVGNKVITYLKKPNLALDFTANTEQLLIGDTLQYTAKLTNTGDLPLTNIQIQGALSPELILLDNLICNHVPLGAKITSGYTLEKLLPTESYIIQFKATVEETSRDAVECSLLIAYDYILEGKTETLSDMFDKVSTSICTPQITFTKTANKNALSLGESFVYTLTATNTSNMPIEEVIFKDTFSSEFQILEVRSGHKLMPNTLEQGIFLGVLSAHSSISLEIHLKVVSLSPSKQISNSLATGNFKLRLGKNLPFKVVCLEAIDPVGIVVTDAELTLLKTVSVPEACLNEEVTYTVTATNTGTVTLTDLTIFDTLTPELKFVMGSVKVNHKPMPTASIISGIKLASLPVTEAVTITFNALILSDSKNTLENTVTAHYTYAPFSSSTHKSSASASSTCTLVIRHPHLILLGEVAQKLAFIDDTLTYHLKFTNDGDIDLFNVLLQHDSPSCTLEDGSFILNTQVINSVNLSEPIHLGRINIGETTEIHYSIKVSDDYHPEDCIENNLVAYFSYSTLNHCLKEGKSDKLNLCVPLALSTFKQFALENYLDLPDPKPDLEVINSIGSTVNLLSHYIIETPKGTSLEGQKLRGYKLMIHALLELTVEYVTLEPSHTVHSAQYSIPFSSFIVLPANCPSHSQMHIDATIQNISFQTVNNRTFFTHSSILLVTHIKS